MCDYSDAEIAAIETSFPGTVVYICGFHREQAWERWVKDHKHDLTSSDADVLLDFFQACVRAPSATPDEDGLKDQNFKVAVDNIKKSNLWKQNQQVQQWLTLICLPVAKVTICNYISVRKLVSCYYNHTLGELQGNQPPSPPPHPPTYTHTARTHTNTHRACIHAHAHTCTHTRTHTSISHADLLLILVSHHAIHCYFLAEVGTNIQR